MAARYTYIWEFLVEPARVGEFERAYGPDGDWVALFRQAPGYIGTLLLRDPSNPLRFLTIDRWQSAAAYHSFRARFAREFAQLDERCERLTTREASLGHYDETV